MSKFTTDLEAKLTGKTWELTSPLVYESDLLDATVTVPTGFKTDFASVPRLPLIYSMWGDRAHREAVVHDYLFRKNSKPAVSFKIANKVFLEAMQATSKPFWVSWPMYAGVCIGSHPYFHIKTVKAKK